jgi:hypothetical protein
MKTPLLFLFILFLSLSIKAQITTPVIRANFGVDAELRSNFFNGFLQNGNDDWFSNSATGTGKYIIDTIGAASMVSRYAVDPAFRKQPFFRTMSVPQYSVINNRLLIDAVYIRDYNGQSGGDETAFVSSNKNGDNPGIWNGGTTSVLDKNDIAEMMVHVRREGPSRTDPLWFFGGLSLQGTTGNRYFDFELYQTDIFFTRSTGRFSNYGPDEGHTSWEFDAQGNIIKPGDVIFSAEYSSSSLTFIEARIWVNRNALNITPASFDWSGSFDGASNSSQFGYASIRPKVAGTYYAGLQSGNSTWAGPFGFINGNNLFQTTYTARQFMEFSVNLTYLGLDPLTLLGGGACGLPFRRILVKTRTSTSFSSELKDFIGPFDFFTAPPVEAVAEVPLFCGSIGVSDIKVQNPLPASVYTWKTLGGNIVGDSTGHTITVNAPGTYIVNQQLLDGCGSFAADTVVIRYEADCVPMEVNPFQLKGQLKEGFAKLNWSVEKVFASDRIQVQRSFDGKYFHTIAQYAYLENAETIEQRVTTDDVSGFKTPDIYYRLEKVTIYGDTNYSKVIRLLNSSKSENVRLYPNPAQDYFQLEMPTTKSGEAEMVIYNMAGTPVLREKVTISAGILKYAEKTFFKGNNGIYVICVQFNGNKYWQKVFLSGKKEGISK